MIYVLDIMIGHVKEFRANGVDCITITKLVLGHENSQIAIDDDRIVDFLLKDPRAITLITMDSRLALKCRSHNIPCIRIQEPVIEYIKKQELDQKVNDAYNKS